MKIEMNAVVALMLTSFRRTLLAGLAVFALTSCGVDEDPWPDTNTTPNSFYRECFITSEGYRHCFLVGQCGVQEDYCAGFSCTTVQRTCVPCGDFSSCWNSG